MSLQKLGRYDLIRVLGKGAMGQVYEGRDPDLDRRVAIKTIRVENLSPEEAADYEVRFRTEARSAARLQHPHIVSVYDAGREGNTAFLVMEFVQGDDLKHHLDQGKRYTLAQSVAIMGDLLAALDYAHRQAVVHRDIKPANLLMAGNGRIKLTDFGVARIQDASEATRTQGSMVGTLKYMSPEQVQGRPVDSRADLFAAGIVLYQLLTSQRPFDGDTDFAVIQQIVAHTPAAPTSFNPQLPSALDEVLARALAKAPAQRFASAREFGAALQAATHQAGDPAVLPPHRFAPSGGSTWTGTVPGTDIPLGLTSGIDIPIVTQEVELVYWKEIKDSGDIEDIQEFLARFPGGIYAGLARRRLRKLGGLAGDDSNIGSQPGATLPPEARVSASAYEPTVLASSAVAAGLDAPTAPVAESPPLADDPAYAAAGVAAPTTAESPAHAHDDSSKPLHRLSPATPEPDAPAAQRAPEKTQATRARRGMLLLVGLVALAGVTILGLSLRPGADATPAARATVPVERRAERPAEPAAPPARDSAGTAATMAPPATAAAPAADRSTVRPAAASKSTAPARERSPRPAAEPGSVEAGNPRIGCDGKNFVSFQICMARQCAKPAFASHPVCEERRAMEQRNRENQR